MSLTFHQACAIITENDHVPALNYAVGYAKAGLEMDALSREAKIQAIYILNNMKSWHGEMAKEVRQALKEMASVK